jgi:orotate phosphoribosyltransferase
VAVSPQPDFLHLLGGRRGHFRLESGHHGAWWFELDALFSDFRSIEPFVRALADAIRPYGPEGICGPLLGGAFLAQMVAHDLGSEFYFTQREMPAQAWGLYQARYRLPRALAARVAGKRLAIVDDVMSAGSALRGTYAEIEAQGAACVVAGALLTLGSTGASFFAGVGLPVVATARQDYELWEPSHCPLCATGLPLEDMTASVA